MRPRPGASFEAPVKREPRAKATMQRSELKSRHMPPNCGAVNLSTRQGARARAQAHALYARCVSPLRDPLPGLTDETESKRSQTQRAYARERPRKTDKQTKKNDRREQPRVRAATPWDELHSTFTIISGWDKKMSPNIWRGEAVEPSNLISMATANGEKGTVAKTIQRQRRS